MKVLIAAFFALFLVPERLVAQPDGTTRHLMQDSVSMLDFGLLRLNINLERDNLGLADFNWDRNRIVIHTWLSEETRDAAEEVCAEWVSEVRTRGGISRESGKPALESSSFSRLFGHYSFERGNILDGLYKNIDQLFVLECNQFNVIPPVMVTAPLLGTGYSLRK